MGSTEDYAHCQRMERGRWVIDRKAECKRIVEDMGPYTDGCARHYRVLKAINKGCNCYMAVMNLTDCAYPESNKGHVFAWQIILHVNNREGTIAYRDPNMDVATGFTEGDRVPATILRMLTPLDQVNNIDEQGKSWAAKARRA